LALIGQLVGRDCASGWGFVKELAGDARSRLRMAHEWLKNWSRLSPDERKSEEISDEDIAALTMAHLNVHGPLDAARELKGWRPSEVSYRVGKSVVRRLVDHGRWPEIDALAQAADSNLFLILAVAYELRKANRAPPADTLTYAFRRLTKKGAKLKTHNHWDDSASLLSAITAVAEAMLKENLCSREEAAELIARYLPETPPRGLESPYSKSRFPTLRAYCLCAALNGRQATLVDLAHPDLKKDIEDTNRHSLSSDVREFEETVGALLPWHNLWASVALGQLDRKDADDELKKALQESQRAERIRYREESHSSDEIALLWMDILIHLDDRRDSAFSALAQWECQLKRPLSVSTLNLLCRMCAQQDHTKSLALRYALKAYALTKDERSDAELEAEGYITIARAVLTTSKADAKAFFNAALDVSGKIGDENLPRWDAILYLAERASRSNRPVPQVAYRLSRCAELTYDYVTRDKHFDWKSTVSALCGLCPSSAIAILSRWRDRGFGWHERLLPIATEALLDSNIITVMDALPLIGFRAEWEYDKLLGRVLTSSLDAEQKSIASNTIYRYAQLSASSSADIADLQKAANDNGITLEVFFTATDTSESEEPPLRKTIASDDVPHEKGAHSRETPWDSIFFCIDVSTSQGLSEAYSRLKASERTWDHEELLTEAMLRVHLGGEVAFIEALTELSHFGLYGYRSLLSTVPDAWKSRPAIAQALSNTAKALCRKHFARVRKNRYYEGFPFDLTYSLTGLTEAEIIDVVLSATGETFDPIDSGQLFSLVGLLATKLTEDEALDALNYGLGLFDASLNDKDGDGPWTDSLSPPTDTRDAIAGYILATLAAPEAVLRWEAAHAVVELCRLDRQHTLEVLVAMTSAARAAPFVDARLPFYRLHAHQWLVIGLARAALDAPGVLAPYGQHLVNWALSDQPHVLIRLYAAQSAIRLIEAGHLLDSDGLLVRLKDVNKASMPAVESAARKRTSSKGNDKKRSGDDRFYFGIDIGPYWYSSLGRVFAVSQSYVEAEALKAIRQDLSFPGQGRWDEDERAKRKLYEEGHAHHSHGSYPRADNLQFYNAYHAMMIVAGRLLATMPVHHDPTYGERDEFAEWLSGHDTARPDGRWLSDRRDRQPASKSAWLRLHKSSPDRYLIAEEAFEEALRSGDMLTLWGRWTEANTSLEQSVQISSALVSHEKSEALLRALSTADDVHDYEIPSFGSDSEISTSGFELRGWIVNSGESARLERLDRWAGEVSFPPPYPAPFFAELMHIEPDADLRIWRTRDSANVIETRVWGHYDEAKRHESSNPNRGNCVQVASLFIPLMLKALDRDLIIEVQIDRRRRYQPYESHGSDDDERSRTSAKLYLFRKDGRTQTV